MKNGTLSGSPSYVTTLPSGWSYLATGDFNGDGTDDILAQDKTGDIVDLTMKNGAVSGTSYVTTLSGGWSFLATGDFNGDGTTDILAQDKAGNIVDLTMKNGAVSGTSYVTTLSGGWSYLAAGDFFGNGTTDILAQDTGGDIVALPMKNGTVSGSPTYVTTLPAGGSSRRKALCCGLDLSGRRLLPRKHSRAGWPAASRAGWRHSAAAIPSERQNN